MKFLSIRKAGALAVLAAAAVGAQAATESVQNGSFSSVVSGVAAPWTENSVSFNGGVATFNGGGDWLSQTFTTLFAAGTSFAGSFFYDKTNNNSNSNSGGNLTYLLQTSPTQNFSGSVTTLGQGTINNNQGDGTFTFGSFALANAGYVRLYFDSLSNRNFSVDNVSVLVTAPVPEPGTYALLLAGLGVIGFVARRRRPTA